MSDPMVQVAANDVGEGEGEGVRVVIMGRVSSAGCDGGRGIRLESFEPVAVSAASTM